LVRVVKALLLRAEVQEEVAEAVEEAKLYNLDVTITAYLVDALKAFKEAEGGYPSNYPDQELWHKKLDSIIVPLSRYSERWNHNLAEECAIVDAGQQAMRDLAEIFPSLWL
jgi:hypothetical protein